jgi:hypothetical protein
MHKLRGYQGQEHATSMPVEANRKIYGGPADIGDVGQQQMRYLQEPHTPASSLDRHTNWSASLMHRQESAGDYASSQ